MLSLVFKPKPTVFQRAGAFIMLIPHFVPQVYRQVVTQGERQSDADDVLQLGAPPAVRKR